MKMRDTSIVNLYTRCLIEAEFYGFTLSITNEWQDHILQSDMFKLDLNCTNAEGKKMVACFASLGELSSFIHGYAVGKELESKDAHVIESS